MGSVGGAPNRDTRRRFEQWASNPQCGANTVSAVHNVRMADVAKKIGIKGTFGASPFALGNGEQFERNLLAKGAERLIPELRQAGLIQPDQSGLLDLRVKMNGGTNPSLVDLDQAILDSLDFLKLAGGAKGAAVLELPALVAALTVRIPRGVMLPEALLIIDAVTVTPVEVDGNTRAMLLVGEIKTYPDRGGETSGGQLAQARAQLGLYLHALEVVTEGFSEVEKPLLSDRGFLVMTKPGTNFPSVRTGEHLRYQAERAARGFERLENVALSLTSGVTDPVAAVLEADTHYSEACLSFCDLAPRCHKSARDVASPSILGDAMTQLLGKLPLDRVLDLLEGAPPFDDREREIVAILKAAEEPGWE